MKKLMSLFASITLLTSTTTTVIACTADRFSTPTLSSELKNLVEAQFNSDIKDGTIDSTYTFGDIFKSNLSNMTTLATRLINQVISKYFENNESVSRQSNAGVVTPTTKNPDTFEQQITNLAKNQLYSDYVKYYETNNQLQDIDMLKSGYTLLDNDPTKDTAAARKADIDAGTANPLIQGVYYVKQKNSNDEWGYNNWEAETNPATQSTSNQDIQSFLFGGGQNWSLNNVKNTLWQCYQDYYTHVELPKIIDNAITSTYLDNNYLQADATSSKSSYLNYRGDLLGGMQNWPVAKTQNPPSMMSNFKLVWKIQVNQNAISHASASENPTSSGRYYPAGSYGFINNQIYRAEQASPPVKAPTAQPITPASADAAVSDVKGRLNPQYWSPDNLKQALVDIFYLDGGKSLLNDATKLGADPVFGVNNFDGFAAYGSDGKIIGSSYTPDTSFGPDLTGTTPEKGNQVGFLEQSKTPTSTQLPSGERYWFADSKSKNDADYVFTLPVYAIDLLHNETYSYQSNKIWPVNLRGYVNGQLPPNDPNNNNLDWAKMHIDKNWKTTYSVNYLYQSGAKGSTPQGSTGPPKSDKTASLGNYTVDGSKPNTGSGVNSEKLDLFRYAEYYFGQESDLATTAKTNYYSEAFDYDPKNVFDQNLYDQIGQYIIDHT